MRNENYMEVAKKLAAEKFPQASCVFVTGSVVTNEHTASSDIDIVVLYNDETTETYRDSLIYEGWPVELFVHNIKSQNYFFEQDIQSGCCIMLDMVAKSRILCGDAVLGEARQKRARELIAKGPSPLTGEQIASRRYMLTDKWDDLRHPKDAAYIPAILAVLYTDLGDFYLRANGKWSGKGKPLVRNLRYENPELARDFIDGFARAHQGDLALLEKVIEKILAPFGGLLFESYKSIAPPEKWQ